MSLTPELGAGRVIDELVTILSFRSNLTGLVRARVALWEYADAVSNIGGKMALWGLGATAANVGNLAMFAGFETNMARIEALVGIPGEQLRDLHGDITRISTDLGVSQASLAEALYFATSAGLELDQAMEAVEASAKGMRTGLGDMDVLMRAAAAAMTAYSKSGMTAAETMDTLTRAITVGMLEPDELSNVIGRVLPLAGKLGVEFTELTGIMAAMSRTGTDADQAATQINAIMRELIRPSQQAARALAGVGLSASGLRDVTEQQGLFKAMEVLWNAMGGDTERIGRVIEETTALTGVFDLFGDQLESNRILLERMQNPTGALDKALNIMARTLGFKFLVLWNNLEEITTGIGKAIAPTSKLLMDAIIPPIRILARTLNSTNPLLQTFVRLFAGMGFMVAISGMLLMLVGAISKLMLVLNLWRYILAPLWTMATNAKVAEEAGQGWIGKQYQTFRRNLGADFKGPFDSLFGRGGKGWSNVSAALKSVTWHMARWGIILPFISYWVVRLMLNLIKLVRVMWTLIGFTHFLEMLRWSFVYLGKAMRTYYGTIIFGGLSGGFRAVRASGMKLWEWLLLFSMFIGGSKFSMPFRAGDRSAGRFSRFLGGTRMIAPIIRLLTIFGRLAPALAAIKVAFMTGWVGAIIIAIAAVVGLAFAVDRYWAGLKRIFAGMDWPLKILLLPLWLVILALKGIWLLIRLIIYSITEGTRRAIRLGVAIWNWLKPAHGFLKVLWDIYRLVYDIIGLVLDFTFFRFLGIADTQPTQQPAGAPTPVFARGGIVPGRSWQAVPAMLHGGEAVLPATLTNRLMQASGSGGGTAISVQFHEGAIVVHDAEDARTIARGIVSNIEYEIRNLGYAFDSGIDT